MVTIVLLDKLTSEVLLTISWLPSVFLVIQYLHSDIHLYTNMQDGPTQLLFISTSSKEKSSANVKFSFITNVY